MMRRSFGGKSKPRVYTSSLFCRTYFALLRINFKRYSSQPLTPVTDICHRSSATIANRENPLSRAENATVIFPLLAVYKVGGLLSSSLRGNWVSCREFYPADR